jgi:hypothetical protein
LDRFLEVATNGGEFQRRLQRYTLALLTQIAQGAACNRLHAIEERCARWLQRAGFISYARGRIRVLGRRGLEDAACECYAVVRDEFRRLVELAEHG